MQLSHRCTPISTDVKAMNPEARAEITVVICTRNRAESLRETLACLARAEVPELHSEIVVVDNGSTDATAEVVRAAPTRRPVRYLVEPHPGKSWGLNRAISDAPLGEIVAVLDDDMSPHADWFKGVKAICDRWPDRDLFTGRSYVIWPIADVPDWCLHPRLRGWAYSVLDANRKDAPLTDGRWFSGNHFWFRSRVLADGRKFQPGPNSLETHIEMAEPQFMLTLVEDGYKGIMSSDAVCGHRIQRELLDFRILKQRALRVGRGYATVRMNPYKSRIKQARLFRTHPLLSRIYCSVSILGWSITRALSWFYPVRVIRIELQLHAIQRKATYIEYLRIASRTSPSHLPIHNQ
jgi:glycosyltransferase involved in cell wall biosynthesis